MLSSSFKERCRPLDKLSTKIEAAVKFPDSLGGKIYAFSGDMVTRVDSLDTFGNVHIDPGYPQTIEQQWPGLDADLDTVFALDEQVVFVKVSFVHSLVPFCAKFPLCLSNTTNS